MSFVSHLLSALFVVILRIVVAIALVGFLFSSRATAQSLLTWDNGGVLGDWNDSLNWSPNSIPGGGDDLTIDSGNSDGVHMLESSFTIRSLDVSSSTLASIVANASGTLTAQSLTFAKRSGSSVVPSLTLSSSSLVLGGNPDGRGQMTVSLTDDTTFDIESTGTGLDIRGPVTGAGMLTKSGPGTLALGFGAPSQLYSNSFDGLSVSAGTVLVEANASGSLGSQLGTGSVMVGTGTLAATLRFANIGTLTGATSISISGTGGGGGGVLRSSGTVAFAGTLALSSGSTVGIDDHIFIAGPISNTVTHSLTKVGAGTLAAVSIRIGTLTINNGTIQIAQTTAPLAQARLIALRWRAEQHRRLLSI